MSQLLITHRQRSARLVKRTESVEDLLDVSAVWTFFKEQIVWLCWFIQLQMTKNCDKAGLSSWCSSYFTQSWAAPCIKNLMRNTRHFTFDDVDISHIHIKHLNSIRYFCVCVKLTHQNMLLIVHIFSTILQFFTMNTNELMNLTHN